MKMMCLSVFLMMKNVYEENHNAFRGTFFIQIEANQEQTKNWRLLFWSCWIQTTIDKPQPPCSAPFQ